MTRPRTLALLALTLLTIAGIAPAQESRMFLSARFEPATAAPGDEVTLVITGDIEPPYHIYGALDEHPTTVSFGATGGLEKVGATLIPPGTEHDMLGIVNYWIEGTAVFKQKFKVPADASGEIKVSGHVDYIPCTPQFCDPDARDPFSAKLVVDPNAAPSAPAPSGQDPAGQDPGAQDPGAQNPGGFPGGELFPQLGGGEVEDLGTSVDKLQVSARFEPAEAAQGETVTLVVSVTVVDDWHIYGGDRDDGSGTTVEIKDTSVVEASGKLVQPAGVPHDNGLGGEDLWLEGSFELRRDYTIASGAPVGDAKIAAVLGFMPCNINTCLDPATIEVEVELKITEGSNLWALIWGGILGGLFALLMPCTYPMIPITISFFTKQAEARGGNVLPLALAYGAGIIIVFLLIGLFAGPFIIEWATHWITNLVIGVVFVIFALSLFGWINLQPPQFLNNLAGKASSQGGYLGVFLMGMTLVFSSFTCTAPFAGSMLSLAASESGGIGEVMLGMGVFGATMAVPFVLLSLMPGKIAQMPRSGEWMTTLKVFLGFVELAAALKFLSNAEVVTGQGVLPRELFLFLWAVIFALAGLFLLGVIKFYSDSGAGISPGRLTAGTAVMMLAAYCFYGTRGYTMDFVMEGIAPPYRAAVSTLPDVNTIFGDAKASVGGSGNGSGAIAGGGGDTADNGHGAAHEIVADDHDAAVRLATEQQKLVLVNFTGYI